VRLFAIRYMLVVKKSVVRIKASKIMRHID